MHTEPENGPPATKSPKCLPNTDLDNQYTAPSLVIRFRGMVTLNIRFMSMCAYMAQRPKSPVLVDVDEARSRPAPMPNIDTTHVSCRCSFKHG